MDKRNLLGLCMIVKDEKDFIKSCIESVKDIVDEIVVADTGSQDATPEIAKKLGAKVYAYPWDGSFSRARNFAISKCSARWLLLLDADERLFEEDKGKLLEFIKDGSSDGALFKIYSYVGDGSGCTVHNALRLLKNDGSYRFKGDIHEQIERIDGAPATGRFALSGIRLHHFGYLEEVLKKKNKRERNIPILLRELEKDPDNAFMLFNLGNEYIALGDYSAAWGCYKKSMALAKSHEAFCPHLYFRAAVCLQNMSKLKEALSVLEKGLKLYPGCTDMEYLKGLIYSDLRLDLLAIKSFEKAIAMGEPHPTLAFSEGCATVKPLLALAEIYIRQKDYAAAEQACLKALSLDNKVYTALYKLGEIAKLKGDDEESASKRLEGLFADLNRPANLILLSDILLEKGFIGRAGEYISSAMASSAHKPDLAVLKAKLHFLKGEYKDSLALLEEFFESGAKPEVLLHLKGEAAALLSCVNLIKAFRGEEKGVYEILSPALDNDKKLVLEQSMELIRGGSKNLLAGADASKALEFFGDILKRLIKRREFELFEKLLYNYNYINSEKVLLHLAAVYHECGLSGLAASAVMRSAKEFGLVDAEGARILLDSLTG